jgi:hypothetical protein
MNVLDFYQGENIEISEPIEIDDDNYFCKLSYKNSPFMVKTNKVCYYKQKNIPNYLYISVTSKEYLEWFEKFYHDCIEKFHTVSADWFEDEMTQSDIECSFINPLKSNIRDNCFDIMCGIDDNRIMVTDTNDNFHSIKTLKDHEVIPTFHIKGIKFNSKHFSLEIEINHLYLILPSDESKEEIQLTNISLTDSQPKEESPKQETPKEESDELSEFVMEIDNLVETDVQLDNLNIYKVYEFLNTKIKETLIEEIRTIFTSRKIKTKINFSEVIDDEEPDE